MSAIDTLRDALLGNPPSPATKPSREGVLAAFSELFGSVDGALKFLLAAFVANQSVAVFATKSQLDASLAPVNGTLGIVWNDGGNTGLYVKNGGAGTGSWSLTGLMLEGRQGDRGPEGKNFYQVAVDAGYVPAGTSQTDFIKKVASDIAAQATADAVAARNTASGAATSARQDATAAGISAQTSVTARQAVLDAIAGVPSGATLPLQATTRALLAAITDRSAGRQVYLSEPGYEGTFKWLAGNQSVLVTNDPRGGAYRAPASDASGASGVWARIFSGRLDWRWFGALGDGKVDANGNLTSGTDDTAAIQAALDFNFLRGGGDVGAPDGIFRVRTATVRNGYRAILHAPQITRPQQMQVCRIKGDSPACLSGSGSAGLILFADFPADSGDIPAIFGAKASGPRGITYLDLGLEDAIIRQPGNPTCHGFDARYAHTYRWVRSRIDQAAIITADGQTDILTVPKPTRPCVGFWGSLNDVPYRGAVEDVVVVGFQFGIVTNELFVGSRVGVSACTKAVYISPASHPCQIDFLELISCKNGIVSEGANHAELFIGMVDIEHSKNVPAWIAVDDGGYGYDIDDPTSVVRGEVRYHCHASGFAQDLPFKMRGGRNLRVMHDLQYDNGYGSQEAFSRIYPGFQNDVVATGIREVSTFADGIAWRSDVAKADVGAGVGAAWSLANFGGAAPSTGDYRIAQYSIGYDGSPRRGFAAITTWRDGQSVDCVKWDSLGRMIFLTPPPFYADDAAAKTAGLPINGVYRRTDGALTFRILA